MRGPEADKNDDEEWAALDRGKWWWGVREEGVETASVEVIDAMAARLQADALQRWGGEKGLRRRPIWIRDWCNAAERKWAGPAPLDPAGSGLILSTGPMSRITDLDFR